MTTIPQHVVYRGCHYKLADAATVYRETRQILDAQLATLTQLLDQHSQLAAQQPDDQGLPGDLQALHAALTPVVHDLELGVAARSRSK